MVAITHEFTGETITVKFEVVKVEPVKKEKWGAKSRVYVWPEGETVLDNLVNRRSRPHAAYRALLDAYAATLEPNHPLTRKMRWSQKAGCSCGCSPGFVLETSQFPDDYHVTIKVTALK